MTAEELERIETRLGVQLPEVYRATCLAYPFRPSYGYLPMFADAESVIANTVTPLANEEYDRAGWADSYVAIGTSPSSDVYVLDVARTPAPVLVLSHEDHRITSEYADFPAFLDAMRRDMQEAEEQQIERAARQRRQNLVVGLLLSALVLVSVLGIGLLILLAALFR